MPNPAVRNSPLLLSSISQLLAASVLAACPTTATEPGADDRRDAHPKTVQRAGAFIESNLDRDIGVADIAAAAGVTVRAVQTAFQRHLGTHRSPICAASVWPRSTRTCWRRTRATERSRRWRPAGVSITTAGWRRRTATSSETLAR